MRRFHNRARGLLMASGKRPFILATGRLRKELLEEAHDTLWVGHLGQKRMVALLTRSCYWPSMKADVELYVRMCLACQRDKVDRGHKAGLLQPLPILEHLWALVSMDFIIGLLLVNRKGPSSWWWTAFRSMQSSWQLQHLVRQKRRWPYSLQGW